VTPHHEAREITPEWCRDVMARLDALGMSRADLARTIHATQATISSILAGTQRTSSWVPAIERAIRMQPAAAPPPAAPALPTPPAPERIARIAELREASDAIGADIVEHEKVRAVIEERLAEAYQRRAEIDVEIRHLRGATP